MLAALFVYAGDVKSLDIVMGIWYYESNIRL